MNSFKKGLSYIALIMAVGIVSSCKTDSTDFSYLENIPVQVPKNIVPIQSATSPVLPDFVSVDYKEYGEIAPAKEYNAGIRITERLHPQAEVEYPPVQELPENVMRVGILLPMSGKMKNVGEEMQNAAMMALADTGNTRLILQFYDTEGTPEGAKEAVNLALNEGAELILGPLFSAEVKAVAEEVKGWSVPVISFSSDNSVLGENIYSIALLITEQIRQVVSYACSMGYKKLAVLAQSNEMGEYAFAAAKQAMESDKCNGEIVKMGFYNPNATDFSKAVKSIMPRALLMKIERERLKKQGYEVIEETLYDENGNIVDERNIPFDFDSVLLAEEGAKLRSLGALLSYYDVTPAKAKILGISMMDDAKIKKEAVFDKAWYTTLSKKGFQHFAERYKELFKEQKEPSRIVSLTYDAVSLAAYLSMQPNRENMHNLIIAPSGFNGIDGPFRLLPDGRVERAMAVMQVRKYGADKEIVPPLTQFTEIPWERVEREEPKLTPHKEVETETESSPGSVKGYDFQGEREIMVYDLP